MKVISTIFLILIFLFPQKSLVFENSSIYKSGTKYYFTASWWGLSANGKIEVIGNTKLHGKDTILIRASLDKLGGLVGFIVKFIRMYKESNTFDSYIDPNKLMSVHYEVYKQNKDGSRRYADIVYFNRNLNVIESNQDDTVILNNVAEDSQDIFSIFLMLIRNFNTEKLFVGKKIEVNLYAYRKISNVKIVLTNQEFIKGKTVYTFKIDDIPEIFKHPTSMVFYVADDGKGLMLPYDAKCTIHTPLLGDIGINGKLKKDQPNF